MTDEMPELKVKNLEQLAGLLSIEDFQHSHPEKALDWIVRHASELMYFIHKEVPISQEVADKIYTSTAQDGKADDYTCCCALKDSEIERLEKEKAELVEALRFVRHRDSRWHDDELVTPLIKKYSKPKQHTEKGE